jgi:hypothetical protein
MVILDVPPHDPPNKDARFAHPTPVGDDARSRSVIVPRLETPRSHGNHGEHGSDLAASRDPRPDCATRYIETTRGILSNKELAPIHGKYAQLRATIRPKETPSELRVCGALFSPGKIVQQLFLRKREANAQIDPRGFKICPGKSQQNRCTTCGHSPSLILLPYHRFHHGMVKASCLVRDKSRYFIRQCNSDRHAPTLPCLAVARNLSTEPRSLERGNGSHQRISTTNQHASTEPRKKRGINIGVPMGAYSHLPLLLQEHLNQTSSEMTIFRGHSFNQIATARYQAFPFAQTQYPQGPGNGYFFRRSQNPRRKIVGESKTPVLLGIGQHFGFPAINPAPFTAENSRKPKSHSIQFDHIKFLPTFTNRPQRAAFVGKNDPAGLQSNRSRHNNFGETCSKEIQTLHNCKSHQHGSIDHREGGHWKYMPDRTQNINSFLTLTPINMNLWFTFVIQNGPTMKSVSTGKDPAAKTRAAIRVNFRNKERSIMGRNSALTKPQSSPRPLVAV